VKHISKKLVIAVLFQTYIPHMDIIAVINALARQRISRYRVFISGDVGWFDDQRVREFISVLQR